jgi:rRNA maturation RNase YbeY
MIDFIGFPNGFSDSKENVTTVVSQIASDHDFVIKSLVFNGLTDSQLLEINISHLDHDTFTDIITFDYTRKNKLSGEIFISLERVKENAATANVPFETELCRIIYHGVLHLVGYKDKLSKDKLLMTSKEDYYLSLQAQ